MAKTGKRYNQEFKEDVIRMVKDGKSVASVARDLGISQQTIHRWIEQHKVKQHPEKSRIMELETELKAAHRRVDDLEETVSILKKAAAIFVTPPRK